MGAYKTQYPTAGNLALKEEFSDIDVQTDSGASALPNDYLPRLLEVKTKGFLSEMEHRANIPFENVENPMTETGTFTFDDDLSPSSLSLDVKEEFVLYEPNLNILHSQLLRSNSRKLVSEFMRTLRYALLSTIAVKGDQIAKIVLRGGILKDTKNLSDPFSLDIELFIILNIESYSLSDVVVTLARKVYGKILDKKQVFFINTVLSQEEWENITPKGEHLILVEKERVLQNSLQEY